MGVARYLEKCRDEEYLSRPRTGRGVTPDSTFGQASVLRDTNRRRPGGSIDYMAEKGRVDHEDEGWRYSPLSNLYDTCTIYSRARR